MKSRDMGTAAIGVELAELVAQVIFAQEEVEACHGQKVVIVAGQHDETMQIIGGSGRARGSSRRQDNAV